jgi:hypothetical protein
MAQKVASMIVFPAYLPDADADCRSNFGLLSRFRQEDA